ncbi:MAG: CsgG/HfaB family protein [Deltaproteobacteria bacterium]|nr:CsgG/HfaB family protein [Deltaproteobacteria bacterium]
MSLALAATFSGCGVLSDLARDNEFHIGSLGQKSFISPVKLRVGVLSFRDEVGLGTPQAGPNMANLVTQRFAEHGRLVLVPSAQVTETAMSLGWTGGELSPALAQQIGQALNLNVVMEGSISQIEQMGGRRGWRRLVRYFTNQQNYVDAVLTLVAYDTATGLVVTARAGEGTHVAGNQPVDYFATDKTPVITQESIELSLDEAIDDLYYRSLDGLAYTPFKAAVIEQNGQTATINFGENVGMKRGLDFVALSEKEVLTSSIAINYVIPGEAKARLVVREVGPDRSSLEILEGSLQVGDYLQSWDD